MKEDDKRLPRLRYIYLYAAAGKVSEGEMSFDDLERSVKDFIGKEVVLPYRPITQDCKGALNFICGSEGAKDKLFVAATNKTGTTIHSFEYVQLKESFDIASHEGEEASVGGIMEAIKPNPNRSRAIVMRIYISKGFIKLKEQEPKSNTTSQLNLKIPAPDPRKYRDIRDGNNWQNPFLMINRDGVSLVARAASTTEWKPVLLEELANTLVGLPLSAWPYGRVIGIMENPIRGANDDELVKQNKAKTEKVLESLGLTINRWPSA